MFSGPQWTIGICAGLLWACGGSEPAHEHIEPTTAQVAEDVPAPLGPPPEVQLVLQPGGVPSVANLSASPVSIRRQVEVRGLTEDTELALGVGCTPPADSPCLTLVPGAAVILGRWPDALGRCACAPCLTLPAPGPDAALSASLVLQGCEPSQPLALPMSSR
ncbi:MAG: hypothetical protein R3B40_13720 [Polyangiales bacterium]|nr:hypothetical protein [Sandaracinaceae bacterium]